MLKIVHNLPLFFQPFEVGNFHYLEVKEQTRVKWVKSCVCSVRYSVVINGSLEGYFQGKRGLRQGDSLFPYLFLFVMEAFTALLHSRVDMGPFNFHPKCRSIGLTHLVFADDLFILCGASQDSFSLINQLLTDFHSFSGLKPNMQKSSIFYAGVSETAADCLILKEKILKRIQGWSNRPISNGGRAQLIQSVLFSVQVYWSSIFVIPSKTIKEIESTLMAFLWSGSEIKSSAAKVKCNHVCNPKEEGGLGFRRIKE
ncbi:uncharacterized protein LOC131327544 [Rhododendron vialii]|uniref:uncharacterized protein LOC131327544 n=1 Tax=Rhododendron vialii TaxID=182163 RepID=UPI00266026B5|nr:uncharacterized protein LOC131327544 [Rhododendron vialii]